MKKFILSAFIIVGLAACQTTAGSGSSEVAAVLDYVKKNNDFSALCKGGSDASRSAITQAVGTLVAAGQIKGDPGSVGKAAGQQMARECRGG